jgi:hypothetical protein
MKNLIINKKQFEMLAEFNLHHETYMDKLNSKEGLNESIQNLTSLYNNVGKELKESTNGVGLGYTLLEGALTLGLPSQTMLTLAEELGVPPKTKKNMVMGYFQKLDRTDKHLDEALLQEGLFNYLKDLLKGKTGESLKKSIIALVLAGKLAMVSTSALAGAAGEIDSSIDVEKFKTELDEIKPHKDNKEPLSHEQKTTHLGILTQSKITTNDGQTLKFQYNGNLDNFDSVNGDNYPQYKQGTPEFNNLQAAFAAAERNGEGVVDGKCHFVKNGKTNVFQGKFIEANGLWYNFTPKQNKTSVQNLDTKLTSTNTDVTNSENNTKVTAIENFKRHDLSGLLPNSGGNIDKLVKLAKTYNPELKKISSEEIKRAIQSAGSLKTVNVDMTKTVS